MINGLFEKRSNLFLKYSTFPNIIFKKGILFHSICCAIFSGTTNLMRGEITYYSISYVSGQRSFQNYLKERQISWRKFSQKSLSYIFYFSSFCFCFFFKMFNVSLPNKFLLYMYLVFKCNALCPINNRKKISFYALVKSNVKKFKRIANRIWFILFNTV